MTHPTRLLSARLFSISLLGIAAACTSCTQPGYRTEVYPGQQGTYTLQRVPQAQQPAQQQQQQQPSAGPSAGQPLAAAPVGQTPAASPPAAPDPTEADADFERIKSLWPNLSPSDRAAVADMTHRLAQRSTASP